jgi:hypothetical protein
MPPKKQLISMMVLDFMEEVHSHSTFVSIHQESKMPQENSLVSLMTLDFMEQVDERKYSRPRLQIDNSGAQTQPHKLRRW